MLNICNNSYCNCRSVKKIAEVNLFCFCLIGCIYHNFIEYIIECLQNIAKEISCKCMLVYICGLRVSYLSRGVGAKGRKVWLIRLNIWRYPQGAFGGNLFLPSNKLDKLWIKATGDLFSKEKFRRIRENFS